MKKIKQKTVDTRPWSTHEDLMDWINGRDLVRHGDVFNPLQYEEEIEEEENEHTGI